MLTLCSEAMVSAIADGPGADWLLERIEGEAEVIVGAPNVVNANARLVELIGDEGSPRLSHLLRRAGIRVVPFDDRHALVAESAHFRFGRGRHPAALEVDDCQAYAVAQVSDSPVLAYGGPFALTDLRLPVA
jgi:ribonuclease VapC